MRMRPMAPVPMFAVLPGHNLLAVTGTPQRGVEVGYVRRRYDVGLSNRLATVLNDQESLPRAGCRLRVPKRLFHRL